MHERDKHTDTAWWHRPRLCIASRAAREKYVQFAVQLFADGVKKAQKDNGTTEKKNVEFDFDPYVDVTPYRLGPMVGTKQYIAIAGTADKKLSYRWQTARADL